MRRFVVPEGVLMAMPRVVRFQDIDAAGILFYPRALEYFHDAYLAHLDNQGIDLPRVLREGAWGAPIVRVEADFKAPMRFGDEIIVLVEGADVGRSSLGVRYRVRASNDASRVYCSGKTVHVFIDPATQKPREIPDDVRAAFTSKEAPAPPPRM